MGPIAAQRHKGDQSGIKSLRDLDKHIRLIGLAELALERNTNAMNVAIQQVKNKHLQEQQEIEAGRQGLLVAVQSYFYAHKPELLTGKAKTVVLNFGKLGERKLKDQIAGVPRKDTPAMEELVETVEQADVNVPIRSARWVTKEDLKQLSDDELKSIGLQRVVGGNEFFVQADKEQLRETEQQG